MWLALVGLAHAAQPVLPPAQLAADADLVVIAEPTSREVRWSPGPDGGIETQVWLAVHETIRGPVAADLTLVLPGGTIGPHTTWVEDVPELPLDAPVLLFLVQSPDGWLVLGGEQGAIPVRLDASDPGFDRDGVLEALGGPDAR